MSKAVELNQSSTKTVTHCEASLGFCSVMKVGTNNHAQGLTLKKRCRSAEIDVDNIPRMNSATAFDR